jgi:hypothetical protein
MKKFIVINKNKYNNLMVYSRNKIEITYNLLNPFYITNLKLKKNLNFSSYRGATNFISTPPAGGATIYNTGPAAASQVQENKNFKPQTEDKQNLLQNKKNNYWYKILFLILFVLLSFFDYKYNIYSYCWTFINNNLKLVYSILYIYYCLNLFVAVIYYSIGYFILSIDNEIKIDLNKIKIKFIRDIIEGLFVTKRLSVNNKKVKNEFLFPLFISLFVLIISGLYVIIKIL